MKKQPEQPRSTRDLVLESTGRRYLEGLGATWENFSGKKVLDIGAYEGAFADAAKNHGADVVSFDLHRANWNSFHRNESEKGSFVQGNALQLPFADGSFDIVMSHAGPFKSGQKELFKEAYRVLRPGGELRLGPVPILPNTEIHGLPNDVEERIAAVRERSREYVRRVAQECGFIDFEYGEHPRNMNGIIHCHFVLKR